MEAELTGNLDFLTFLFGSGCQFTFEDAIDAQTLLTAEGNPLLPCERTLEKQDVYVFMYEVILYAITYIVECLICLSHVVLTHEL